MCPVPQVSPSPSWEPQSIWVPRRDRKRPLVPLWNVPSQSLQALRRKVPTATLSPRGQVLGTCWPACPRPHQAWHPCSHSLNGKEPIPPSFMTGSNCDGTGDTADWRPVQRPLSGEGHGGSERCWGHEGHCAKSEEPLEKVQPQKLGDRVTGMDS